MADDTGPAGGSTSDPAELADTDQAGQPASATMDDADYAEAGGDAPISTPSGAAANNSASRVGEREPGDTADIGSTDAMTSSTGGLAGTSR